MIDFTLKTYQKLLGSFIQKQFLFMTFDGYLNNTVPNNVIILRHDVDLLPYNSLRTAEIEASMGIKGVYYFRAVPKSWNEPIIRRISELGHEIGYHYENLTVCRGNIDAAYIDFCNNLERLRKIVPVSTICMHGSPRSPYDSKDIWKKYSYRDLGIIGEPYFDIDFSEMFYLTDTGRRWDGYKVSVRDRIEGYSEKWQKQGLIYHSTVDILTALNEGNIPHEIMITIHPQRWNPMGYKWLKELTLQNAKNMVKRVLISHK